MGETWEFEKVVSYFMVEGDSILSSLRTVGIMLPLSEVKRTESGSVSEAAYDPKEKSAVPEEVEYQTIVRTPVARVICR